MPTKRTETLAPLFDDAAAGIRVDALSNGRQVRVVLPEARLAERLCAALLSARGERFGIVAASASRSGRSFAVAATFAGDRDQLDALERCLVGFATACALRPAPAAQRCVGPRAPRGGGSEL